jgi:hypothetical protein
VSVRIWDLNTAAANLTNAQKALQLVRREAEEAWNDEIHRHFEERFLVPLDLKVKRMLDAIRHLSDVLNTARRDCDDR